MARPWERAPAGGRPHLLQGAVTAQVSNPAGGPRTNPNNTPIQSRTLWITLVNYLMQYCVLYDMCFVVPAADRIIQGVIDRPRGRRLVPRPLAPMLPPRMTVRCAWTWIINVLLSINHCALIIIANWDDVFFVIFVVPPHLHMLVERCAHKLVYAVCVTSVLDTGHEFGRGIK